MIIPEFWAEGRIQKRFPDRQITVRRQGWSDVCQEDAQRHADQRTQEAFDRVANGEPLKRTEPKVSYNGADGVPIREQIVQRIGDSIISRNSYGARCLNTPNVFFADIDFDHRHVFRGLKKHPGCRPFRTCLLPILVGIAAAWLLKNAGLGFLAAVAFTIAPTLIPWAIRKLRIWHAGGREAFAIKQVDRFVERQPEWHLRIYRTPNGLRLLAMHQTFDPRSKEVEDAFIKMGVDRMFGLMCIKQNCFRARLTAKPWRIGLASPLKPRRGVWPMNPDHLAAREVWVQDYEAEAAGYSACRFLKATGAIHRVDPSAQTICEYHDRACRSQDQIPSA